MTSAQTSGLFLDRDHEDFVRSIERMNQMYRQQVSSIPTLSFVENQKDGSQQVIGADRRLMSFKKTLQDEIDEIDTAALKAASAINTRDRTTGIVALTATADVLADIIIFCVSEMRKFGLPPAAIMKIVMDSNMSKLQPDGSAKYDDHGKFLKGPNYAPPEPELFTLISQLAEGHELIDDQTGWVCQRQSRDGEV